MDLTRLELKKIATHFVGNKLRDEGIKLSEEITEVNEATRDVLLKYLLLPFKLKEYFKFSHSVDLKMNDIYILVKDIFISNDTFLENSQNITKLLYEYSVHPKIKSGELHIVFFSEIIIEDEVVEAIGIFKSENKAPFLKFNSERNHYSVNHELGTDIQSLDKGCLILNTNAEEGYKVLVIASAFKSPDAQYWKDEFLKLAPISDDFHHTKNYLSIAKEFVTKQLNQDLEVTKAEQIDYLNKSVDYFKSNSHFDEMEFTQQVFENPLVIDSFDKFKTEYVQEKKIDFNPDFEISSQAVKKQAKAFKRVLKLDRNFDIYIHGDKELIEKGIESDGRKYYKIYYKEEE